MSKDNSGALFRNDKKDKNNPDHEKWADHTGSGRINGIDCWISGWVREKDGKKYFSLAFRPKEERKDAPKPPFKGSSGPDLDDSIPFMYEWR